jgi:hypothetical protein
MKSLLLSLLILLAGSLHSQTPVKINTALQRELDSMYEADQHWREFIMCVQYNVCSRLNKDSLIKASGKDQASLVREYWTKQNLSDSLNFLRAKEIIKKYGYPGKSLVGEPANISIMYIFQHADDDTLVKYYPYMEIAAAKKEIPLKDFALMEDRYLMYKGLPQKYGTQVREIFIKDSITGESKNVNYFWPIADEKNVDKRRKQAGIPTTIKENAEYFGVQYDPKRKNPFLHLLRH